MGYLGLQTYQNLGQLSTNFSFFCQSSDRWIILPDIEPKFERAIQKSGCHGYHHRFCGLTDRGGLLLILIFRVLHDIHQASQHFLDDGVGFF